MKNFLAEPNLQNMLDGSKYEIALTYSNILFLMFKGNLGIKVSGENLEWIQLFSFLIFWGVYFVAETTKLK